MSHPNVDLTRSGYDAFRTGHAAAIAGMLDPDIEWIAYSGNDRLPGGGTFRGLAAVATGVFMQMKSTWTAFEFRPEAFFAAGEEVVVVTGRMWARVRATGAEIDVPFAHIWEVADGRARRVQFFTDTLTVHDALGAPAQG
jgi:ketosteroid isomerase-like protein